MKIFTMHQPLFAFFFLLSSLAFADRVDLQVRTSCFLPQDSTFRKVYDNHFEDVQLEASWDGCCCFIPWANLSYYEKRGRSTCQEKRSRIHSASLTLGAKKYFCSGDCWSPYFGLGAGVDYKIFHDKASYVKRKLSRYCPTIILKSGIEYEISCNLFLNFYLDYSYTKLFGKSCSDGIKYRSFNVGGLFGGIGVGMRW